MTCCGGTRRHGWRPGLAESWDTTDYQTYRIKLRHGVPFHDGHEMTSADVVFTFTSMVDPAFASPWRGAFRDLQSVVAVDRYTVDFVLKQPSGSFLAEPGVQDRARRRRA